MLTGFVVMAAVSLGAYLVLQQIGFSSAERSASPSVRLD